MKSVKDQVLGQFREQAADQVLDQVLEQVRNQVWDQVSNQVRDQVLDQVSGQILLKTSNKDYIYWPNRSTIIETQLNKVLSITRG